MWGKESSAIHSFWKVFFLVFGWIHLVFGVEWHCNSRITNTDITILFCYQYYSITYENVVINQTIRSVPKKFPSHCCDRSGYYCRAALYPIFNANGVIQVRSLPAQRLMECAADVMIRDTRLLARIRRIWTRPGPIGRHM
jgi:hypothetical protein